MRKKIVMTGLVLVLLLALTACGMPYSSYDLDEYVKLPEYTELKAEVPEVKITKDDVNDYIDGLLQAATTTKTVTSGKVQKGDTAIINYEGKLNGEPFDGGSAENYSLLIGSGTFIDGFEDGLIGKEVGGDPFDLELTFPKDYPNNPDLAGKQVVFTVQITARKTPVTPELDMDFIEAQGSEAESVKEYRKEIKEQLTEEAEEEAKDNVKADLWSQVMNGTEAVQDEDGNDKYPEEEITRVHDMMQEQYEEYAEQYGVDFDTFLEQYMGMTKEDFDTEVNEYAKTVVLEDEAIYAIAKKENIHVSKNDVKEFKEKMAKAMGAPDVETFEEMSGQTMEEYMGGKEYLLREVYLDKVQERLYELNTAEDTEDAEAKDAEESEEKDDSKDDSEKTEDAD